MKAFLPFLLPLAIYFLVLGLINRRWRPLVVSGPWDFAGLLFAASGFLLFGGPAILGMLNQRWRMAWLFSGPQPAQGIINDGYYFWLSLWLLYFLAVVTGSGYMLWRRRNQLAVYNVEPAVFDEALAHVLDRLGLSWSRAGRHWYIGYVGSSARGVQTAAVARPVASDNPGIQVSVPSPAAEAPLPASPGNPVLEPVSYGTRIEVDPSPAMCHVTLYWVEVDVPLRQEIESDLRPILGQVYTGANNSGAWFIVIAAFLFCLLLFLTTVLLILPGIFQE